MDILQDPMLQEALEMLESAKSEVTRIEGFISTYKELKAKTIDTGPRSFALNSQAANLNSKPVTISDQPMQWPAIREETKKLIQANGGTITNAPTIAKVLLGMGFNTDKDTVSACLTQAKEFEYKREKGGWHMVDDSHTNSANNEFLEMLG